MQNRYEYSVIDVCQRLHGDFTGSSDPIGDEDRARMVRWLDERISPVGWLPSIGPAVDDYDVAVRNLARATLGEVNR